MNKENNIIRRRPENCVALITGATGSLGRTLVEQMAITGRYKKIYACFKSNVSIANKLLSFPSVELCQCDFLSGDYQNLPTRVDVLVNNAALPASKNNTGEVTKVEYDALMLINAYTPFMLAQKYLKGMAVSQWGRIVNVGSIWSLRGSENNLAYNMSKHALSGLTKTIAIEYGALGITCNEVCPGPIESEMVDRIFEARSLTAGQTAQELKREFVNTLRSKRMVSTNEVASVISFLTTEEASGVNGVSIPVDLGFIV